MNLTLYFRLILLSIFQRQVVAGKKTIFDEPMAYNNQLFYCPPIYAKDGFNVSLQVHNGNYCESNNGYRKLGHTMIEVEFGFPSESEPLIVEYADGNSSGEITNSVGKIPIEVMEKVFEKHGGIDWEKTISVEIFEKLIKGR